MSDANGMLKFECGTLAKNKGRSFAALSMTAKNKGEKGGQAGLVFDRGEGNGGGQRVIREDDFSAAGDHEIQLVHADER